MRRTSILVAARWERSLFLSIHRFAPTPAAKFGLALDFAVLAASTLVATHGSWAVRLTWVAGALFVFWMTSSVAHHYSHSAERPAWEEVVLTFVMPNGIEYWQVEESTWKNAPILENPTGHIYYHGRKLQIYSTGGAIQMVALPTKGGTYWVTNSILNELSNSTMIAIAKSLRPLRR